VCAFLMCSTSSFANHYESAFKSLTETVSETHGLPSKHGHAGLGERWHGGTVALWHGSILGDSSRSFPDHVPYSEVAVWRCYLRLRHKLFLAMSLRAGVTPPPPSQVAVLLGDVTFCHL